MKIMRTRAIILALFLLGSIAISAAQTTKPAATSRQSADATARKQFAAALAEFREQPGDTDLRDKVIRLARSLKPAPAIPPEARDCFAQGMAQFERAATAEDFRGAAKQFELAVQAAPWYAEAYYKLAAAYAKAGDYEKEKQALRVYMTAVRDESSVQAAQNLIKEAEYKQAQAEFEQALASLKKDPSNNALREKIVRQAASFNPPLTVPEEAERYLARGKSAFEDAKEPAEFKDAVLQFLRARDAAPWYGPIYYSLGVAQSTAGYYKAARENLSLYLAWEHDPAGIKAAKDLIYQAEYKQEKAEAEQAKKDAEAEAERRKLQAKQALLDGLNGNWNCRQGCNSASVRVSQGDFSASLSTGWTLRGTLNELALEGIATQPGFLHKQSNCNVPSSTHNFSGTLSEDGKTITVRTEENRYYMRWMNGNLFTPTTCTDYTVTNVDAVMITLYKGEAAASPSPDRPIPTGTRRR